MDLPTSTAKSDSKEGRRPQSSPRRRCWTSQANTPPTFVERGASAAEKNRLILNIEKLVAECRSPVSYPDLSRLYEQTFQEPLMIHETFGMSAVTALLTDPRLLRKFKTDVGPHGLIYLTTLEAGPTDTCHRTQNNRHDANLEALGGEYGPLTEAEWGEIEQMAERVAENGGRGGNAETNVSTRPKTEMNITRSLNQTKM